MKLTGEIIKVRYINEDNGYSVFDLNTSDGEIKIVGIFDSVNIGESLEVEGEFTYDNKYGEQLNVTSYRKKLPSSVVEIERYLSSGIIATIGPKNAGYIVETEAYLGEFDRAAHGYGKKRTPKVEALFEKAGTVYIHSIHSHKMLNIVTCEKGNPQSVLIRAIEPILNIERMEENRGKSGILVSNGPGKFTKAFGIDDRFYKTEIQIVEKNMFEIENFFEKLENKNFKIKYDISKINEKYLYLDFENAKIPKKIGTSARIGVPNKGVWTEKKLRFFVEGNRFVSGMRKAEMKDDVWE